MHMKLDESHKLNQNWYWILLIKNQNQWKEGIISSFPFELDPQHETTSSSSETSPGSLNRKTKSSYLSRKPGKSTQNLAKRHVRSSSGYSSHNEETTFRWASIFWNVWKFNLKSVLIVYFTQFQHIELS